VRAILTYHSIDDSGSPISCRRDAFVRHVAWFASRRVRVVGIAELLAMPPSADGLAITFDDAFENFTEFAAPRLLAHGLPVTLFPVTDRVGHSNTWSRGANVPALPLLTWDGLADLHGKGVSIGSHTRTHPHLTRISRSALYDEVQGSAELIAKAIGAHPSVFAYPYGSVDATVAGVVARTYAHACTTEFQVIDGGVQAAWLPRLDAFYFQQPGRLELWGTPTFGRFVERRQRLRRIRRAPAAIARGLRDLTR
jgi:peptidoglycan/xylan/chitin deacetylase (PgdA/CDA1 family)